MLQANQRVEEYKRQIKSLTVKLKEVSSVSRNVEAVVALQGALLILFTSTFTIRCIDGPGTFGPDYVHEDLFRDRLILYFQMFDSVIVSVRFLTLNRQLNPSYHVV
jgi:hypothetical protein